MAVNYGSKRIVVGAHYGLRDWLAAYRAHPERLTGPDAVASTPPPTTPPGTASLARYAGLTARHDEVPHEFH